MQQYKIKITLANGDVCQARAVGSNENDALRRIMTQGDFKALLKGTHIIKVEYLGAEQYRAARPDNYILTKSETDKNKWVLADKINNIVIIFAEKDFANTAKISFLNDKPVSASKSAQLLRMAGEYLATFHGDKI